MLHVLRYERMEFSWKHIVYEFVSIAERSEGAAVLKSMDGCCSVVFRVQRVSVVQS